MSDDQSQGSSSVVDLFFDWYHVPALVLVVAAMLAIRLQAYDNFLQNGMVYFSGNDAWYHLRQVEYTVRHWPFTMPYDPWTNFPYGTNAGQFGTLYDQLVATAALVVGLGSPSATTVAKTLLVAPAVFGALVAVPVYAVGKRLAGRLAGLFGAVVLLLLPGQFLQRGLVGFADHNIAEPFFQVLAVLALMVALAVARRETPVWELVQDRDRGALRDPLAWSALAGVAVALYMWVWPPGVLLVGIFGVYLVYQLTSDYVTGGSPEPVAFVGVVSMVVTGLLMLVQMDTMSFGATDFSLLQPVLAFAVAAGAAFMAGLARAFDGQDLDRSLYPVAVVGLLLVGLGVVAVALPSLFNTIRTNLLSFIGFSATAGLRTISEAQPYLSPSSLQQNLTTATGRILSDYGFTLFTGVVAVIWLLAKPLVRDGETERVGYALGSLSLIGLVFLFPGPFRALGDALGVVSELVGIALVAAILFGAVLQTNYDAEKLLFVVWAAFVTMAAFTQIRFHYYLAPVVAIANAYLIGQVLAYLDLDRATLDAVRDLQGYQVLAVVAAAMLIVTPVLLVPMSVRNSGNAQFDRSEQSWKAAQSNGPGAVTQWDGSLQWMESNTPAPGTFGGADNEMQYYGQYSPPPGEDFDYPAGAYGVQSWWDYGHWITVRGERIPNANPFQQGSTDAANYLLAPNETAAQDALGERDTEAAGTRYVMVDWQMVNPQAKFAAPTVFYDRANVTQSDFYNPVYASNLRTNFYLRNQRYYESLMVRLYAYHGSAMNPQPVVVDWEQRRAQTQTGRTVTIRAGPQDGRMIKQFDNMSAARAYVENDSTSQIGGLGDYPTERVSALQHYRLVKVSESRANESSQYRAATRRTFAATGLPPSSQTVNQPSWVKTFEKVPGATITSTGLPPNTSVRASVPMRIPASNETFTYVQEARTTENGELTMTLPYSTTGYDDYGPSNGYTNVSVRATGPYVVESALAVQNQSLVQYRSEIQVREGRVNGDIEGTRQVTLEQTDPLQNLSLGGGGGNTSESLDPVDPVVDAGGSAGGDSGGTPTPTVDDGPAAQRALTAAAVARN